MPIYTVNKNLLSQVEIQCHYTKDDKNQGEVIISSPTRLCFYMNGESLRSLFNFSLFVL